LGSGLIATTESAFHGSALAVRAPELSDEDLIKRFLEGTESTSQAAFRVLVNRHGPMVLGVCRNILDQLPDAEDAFQATFLVLARKAGSIRDRRVLGRWLYEVARRVAIRNRNRSGRRRTHEMEAAKMSAVGPWDQSDPAWNELRPVLHEEVDRLPEKYRSAVVLCYLQGRTNEEAAELLSWPVGTVKGRLSRARDLLRSRLTSRGLTLSAAFLMTCLSRNAVIADAVPSRLVDETTRMAVAFARGGQAGGTTLAPGVRELVDDALKTRLALSRRALALGLVVLVALLIGQYVVLTPSAGSGLDLIPELFRSATGLGGAPRANCH